MVRLQPAGVAVLVGERVFSSSHYGSTATGFFASANPRILLLSIPLWFDCNQARKKERDGLTMSPSHYGSTATVMDGGVEIPVVKSLHPTMVRLQLLKPSRLPSPSTSLHPTMVRLQPALFSRLADLSPRSPSHYGSTATHRSPRRSCCSSPSPSHYGSTATWGNGPLPFPQKEVSIPLWFDCNSLRGRGGRER